MLPSGADEQHGDIGRNGDKTQTNDLLVEYEVIEYGIQHPVQPQVDSAANRVTECLERYYRPDRTDIKEVDNLRKALGWCHAENSFGSEMSSE